MTTYDKTAVEITTESQIREIWMEIATAKGFDDSGRATLLLSPQSYMNLGNFSFLNREDHSWGVGKYRLILEI